eukprot:8010312-Pyramimonas_sp.AAC.1
MGSGFVRWRRGSTTCSLCSPRGGPSTLWAPSGGWNRCGCDPMWLFIGPDGRPNHALSTSAMCTP